MASWDVMLDGVGYMIAPGSYRATGKRQTTAGSTSRRTSHHLAEFSAGLVDPERSDLFDVEPNGAWPAPWPLGASAIGAAPRRAQVSGTLNTAEPKLTAVGGGYLFIAAGSQLYRWSGSGSVAQRLNLAANAVDITRRGEDLFIAYGTSADVQRWHDASGTSTLSVLGAGEQATHLGAAGEMLVTAPPATPDRVEVWNSSLSASTTILLGGNVRKIANGGDVLLIATDPRSRRFGARATSASRSSESPASRRSCNPRTTSPG